MPLSDAKARNAKPQTKPYKIADGEGLFLLVTPSGSKYWRLKYRFAGREKLLALAAVLNMPLRVLQASMNLLKGIHPDAAELLKDKNICPKALRLFKRVNGNRQIEMAEMMVTMNNFVAGYAEALVLGTPQHQLVRGALRTGT